MSERVDIIDNLIISISISLIKPYAWKLHFLLVISLRLVILFSLIQIGPPNSQFLKSKDKSTWTAKDVVDSVLADKAALVICLRVSSLQ